MTAIKVKANPQNLKWAREESGFSIHDIADHLKISEETLKEWEQSGEDIHFAKLEKLAKKYKRQVAVFFLEKTPKKTKKPNDFRNLNTDVGGLHEETLLAIRRTSRYLEVYRDTQEREVIEEQYKWLSELQQNKQSQPKYLREILEITNDSQKLRKNQSFAFWRKRIEEKLSIFIFQFAIGENELDGFSYIDDGKPYGITINKEISENRKVFTLFHEIAHIIDGQAGLCLTTELGSTGFNIESKCNTFAAQFLMPVELMKSPNDFDELSSFADYLGVSREAYLIRAKELHKVSDETFNKLIMIVRKINDKYKVKIKRNKSDKFGIPRDVISKSQRGEKFFEFVIDRYNSNKMSPTLARDLLDIKMVGFGRPPK